MFVISYFSRTLGKPISAKFDTLQAATAAASEIFRVSGIVVGIEFK
jgi:hypothetical protein